MNYPQLERFIDIVKKLRDPDTGCPWDIKQNHSSLLKYLLEESYEYVDAVESNDISLMEEELGDVLLQVILHAQVGKDDKNFDIESVAKKIGDKMMRRHPHVFDNPENEKLTPEEVKIRWEKIKHTEKKKEYFIEKSVLNGPSLFSAGEIGRKTKKVNFDWDNYKEVFLKLEEEIEELKVELNAKKPNKKNIEEEMGDLLFSAAQLARHLDLDPEITLRKANQKFLKRFHSVEDILKSKNLEIRDRLDQEKLEECWKQVKNENKT